MLKSSWSNLAIHQLESHHQSQDSLLNLKSVVLPSVVKPLLSSSLPSWSCSLQRPVQISSTLVKSEEILKATEICMLSSKPVQVTWILKKYWKNRHKNLSKGCNASCRWQLTRLLSPRQLLLCHKNLSATASCRVSRKSQCVCWVYTNANCGEFTLLKDCLLETKNPPCLGNIRPQACHWPRWWLLPFNFLTQAI